VYSVDAIWQSTGNGIKIKYDVYKSTLDAFCRENDVKTGVGLAHLSRHLTKTINDEHPFKKVRNISSITSACCSISVVTIEMLISF